MINWRPHPPPSTSHQPRSRSPAGVLVHLPREHGYGVIPRTKNGPALAGYGAVTMKNALASTITTLPEQLRRSVAWDRGKEMSAHAAFKVETGIPVYFADPHSPWQRGTNETAMACSANTSPKEQTSHVGTPRSSRPSPTHSTTDHARHSDGKLPPKHLTNTYNRSNNPVLRPPVESVPASRQCCSQHAENPTHRRPAHGAAH